MESNNIIFIIQINYDNDIYELKTDNKIALEQLKKKSLDYFKIDKEDEKFMKFSYIGEDGENNFIGNKENEIFQSTKQIDNEHYLLKLNLTLNKYDKNNKEKLVKEKEININQKKIIIN